jgi:hypothetical protein
LLLVGAPGEGLDAALPSSSSSASSSPFYAPAGAGAAYVSTRQGACRWSAPRFLAPPQASSSSSPLAVVAFGSSVAASGDGSTLVVGSNLLRSDGTESPLHIRPVVYVADVSTGAIVRQEAGGVWGDNEAAAAEEARLLSAGDAGALASAVFAGRARKALARGAAKASTAGAGQSSEVFSEIASVFVASSSSSPPGGEYGRAVGLPIELAAASPTSGHPLQLTGGLRVSLSEDGRTAVASVHALYAATAKRGAKASGAEIAGSVQVFSAAGGSAFELAQRLDQAPVAAGGFSDAALWAAAHALSGDGKVLAVLHSDADGKAGSGSDAIVVLRRDQEKEQETFDAAAAERIEVGERVASLALSGDGRVMAVGLASGQAVTYGLSSSSGSWARECAFSAAGSGGAAEVRLASSRLVVSTPGAPARVYALRSGTSSSCPSSPVHELGSAVGAAWSRALGGGGAGGAAPLAVSSGSSSSSRAYAVIGAPDASLDERLPGSGGLFSFVV